MTVLVPVKYSRTHFFTCQHAELLYSAEFIKRHILWVLTEVTAIAGMKDIFVMFF
jgi:hypothetical protein